MIVSLSRYQALERDRDFWRAQYHALLHQALVKPLEPAPQGDVPPSDLGPLPGPVEDLIELTYGRTSATGKQVRRAVRDRFPGNWDDPATVKAMHDYILKGEQVEV
jgi:hypothetical protein